MKNVSIQGIIPPILTPMNADESINEQERAVRSTERLRPAFMAFLPSAPTARPTP